MGGLLTWFDAKFVELDSDWREVVQALDPASLYRQYGDKLSCGEYVVRSARVIEQTFGGITANLWDDPFEWTLPETLTTPEELLRYFDEVEATRRRGFERFKTDEDLMKAIMTPAGETYLLSLLLDTLLRAGHYHLDAKQALKELTRRRRDPSISANLA